MNKNSIPEIIGKLIAFILLSAATIAAALLSVGLVALVFKVVVRWVVA